MTSEGLGDMFEGDSADTWLLIWHIQPSILRGARSDQSSIFLFSFVIGISLFAVLMTCLSKSGLDFPTNLLNKSPGNEGNLKDI